MIAYIPLLFAIVGAVVYLLAASPKVVELARLVFASGTLVTLLAFANHSIRIFPS